MSMSTVFSLLRKKLHGLILQSVHLLVSFKEIFLSLLVGDLVYITVLFFRLFQQGSFRFLLDDGKGESTSDGYSCR